MLSIAAQRQCPTIPPNKDEREEHKKMRGFIPYQNEDGRVCPWEYLPCSSITPKLGMALALASGKLVIATGAMKPAFISMVAKSPAVSTGEIIPVIRVQPDQVFECTNCASLAGINIGSKVTLHATNGMQVTGTTSSGVAEIVAKDGDAAGSRVLVRFN